METNDFLANKRLIVILLTTMFFCSCKNEKDESLKVAISPYQDIAMIVNVNHLGLEKKYNTKLELISMNWEEILPAVGSAGKTVDVGFGSLTEFLTKQGNINSNSADPILFLYPAYIFRGGGFVSFDNNIPGLTKENLNSDSFVKRFLSYRIGAQKNSIYEMVLYSLAKKHNIEISKLKIFDTPLNDGILAAQNGSLDISEAGLTQITETLKNKGKIVLSMDDMGFADIVGFICKKSVYEKRKDEIRNLIRMWYECVAYVMRDIDNNSKVSLDYLSKKAATKYTLEQYKTALSQEYFPLNPAETEKEILDTVGRFPLKKIATDISSYLISNKIVNTPPIIPNVISIK